MSFVNALQTYINDPSHPAVLYFDDEVVIIRDAFPKAMRHYLVIPRLKTITKVHPLEAFTTRPDVYAQMSQYVEKAKSLMVESLVTLGIVRDDKSSRSEFRATFIRAGVHSLPSLANLHIHVISQDFHLDRMKSKKHYNSFTTEFFVDFDALDPVASRPAASDYLEQSSDSDSSDWDLTEPLSARRPISKLRANSPSRMNRDPTALKSLLKDKPLTCVYCGKEFGSGIRQLKTHLAHEYDRKFLPKTGEIQVPALVVAPLHDRPVG